MSDTYLAHAHSAHIIFQKRKQNNALRSFFPDNQRKTGNRKKSTWGTESWHTLLPNIETAYTPWLRANGSLTLHIQQRCNNFSVRNVQNHLAVAMYDETALLGLPARQRIYTREVFLHADDHPVVYAHSVVSAQHLRGAWHALQNLGTRPLGALLFAHPLVKRSELHFHALKLSHPLYQRATTALDSPPPRLWARRSLFILHDAPLLVTEIFLPDILALRK